MCFLVKPAFDGNRIHKQFMLPRTYQGLLEVSHFHLFAMGMLLLVLTHLVLFVPLRNGVKAWLVAVPFASALLDEAKPENLKAMIDFTKEYGVYS